MRALKTETALTVFTDDGDLLSVEHRVFCAVVVSKLMNGEQTGAVERRVTVSAGEQW